MVLSDEKLIEHYRSAHDPATAGTQADELLRRYSARVVSWCWRFSGDREAAQDLAQEVLLKAYRNLEAFRSDAKFSTWLYSIARNHCLNFIRSRASQAIDMAESLDVDPLDARDTNVLNKLERESDLEVIRQIITQTLDETEAKVMMLHYGEEVPLDDVTRMLGLGNQSGAKAYIVSAKRKLSVAVRRWRASVEGKRP